VGEETVALLRSGVDVRLQALSTFLLVLLACQPTTTSYNVDVPPPSGSAAMILPMASALPHTEPSATPVQGAFRIGDAVEVEWQNDWWPAHVLTVVAQFPPTYRIRYDGYGSEWDEDVGLDRIRKPE
jgi:hypothetical protein